MLSSVSKSSSSGFSSSNFDPIRKSEVAGGKGGVESSFDTDFNGGSSGEGR